MRSIGFHIWNIWAAGGPFVGDEGAPHGRVTVEPYWHLETTGNPVGAYTKGPIRSFQKDDNNQFEVEVPNVETIEIDRSLDTDAAGCTIVLTNTKHRVNTDPSSFGAADLGSPGFYTWNYGASPEANARWGQAGNDWQNVLVPDAILRTYQGYGGKNKTIQQAIDDHNIVLTGLWLVDSVTVSSSGKLTMQCRDPAKLLLEQICFPPIVPEAEYPIQRCRWSYTPYYIPGTAATNTRADKRSEYGICTDLGSVNSGNELWPGSGHGHFPSDAFDGNSESYWYSVGNDDFRQPYAVEWIEICCGEDVNCVYVHPWAGDYIMYVSVWENGHWADEGIGSVDYNPAGIGRYVGANTANVPYVMSAGVPWETPQEYALPRVYHADKIRLTFSNLAYSPDGPFHYRAGVREARARMLTNQAGTPAQQGVVKGDGNYRDYTELVRDLLLWSGFWLRDAYDVAGQPQVFGNLENTGIYAEDCIAAEVFDKKPIIDVLKTLKEIVGYICWCDEDGAMHFEAPNVWGPGNFDDAGGHQTFIPEIDEKVTLLDYSATMNDRALVSEIIISSERPVNGTFDSTITTRYRPSTADMLRGIERPFGWVNLVFSNQDEQRIMAELVALNIFFQLRQGQVTCVANPAIQINDQVRIYERTTGESYIHYIRGIRTSMDLKSGAYTSTLQTHWMGDDSDWVITSGHMGDAANPRFTISAALIAFLERTNSRAVAVGKVYRDRSPTIVGRT